MCAEMASPYAHRGSSVRSSNGCWTCRLRRKKCDECRPVCYACSILHITCYYDREKPEWMDGGQRQEEMALRFKREIKANRRGEHISGKHASVGPQEVRKSNNEQSVPKCSYDDATTRLVSKPQTENDCTASNKCYKRDMALGRSDTILLSFYLDHLFPFLFPFYRPSVVEGGRSWILELILTSPVLRESTLFQSSYFFSLARGTDNPDIDLNTVLAQSRTSFDLLRRSLLVVEGQITNDHIYGAPRVLVSLIQMQRFETAFWNFDNCQKHLNSALSLFELLLNYGLNSELAERKSSFDAIISLLGPRSWILPTQNVQVPSAEQAAFSFSSALLILDDIIASTVLQEQPRLYEYHQCLLAAADGVAPPIDFENIIGCQNWVLLQIANISALDAWKLQCRRVGNLNVMELVSRATVIKNSLDTHLAQLEKGQVIAHRSYRLLDILTAENSQRSKTSISERSLVTCVWAHAALVYLSVVVSGWQPLSVEIHPHVRRILELLTQIWPPALLRTMAWPFCVSGCLAEPSQENNFRAIAQDLRPYNVFGTVRKALEIMENVWHQRDTVDSGSRDFAMCFKNSKGLVLLV